jgi:ribosomal protein S18 acetylase RimI-like enzyme
MQIRAATPADAEPIRQVSARSCRAAYEGILDDESLIETMEDPSIAEDINDFLAETGDDDHVVYLVATPDDDPDDVRGFIQLLVGDHAPDPVAQETAYLKSLYVHPDDWGEGIGSDLMDAGIKRLPDWSTRVRLDVLVDNTIGRSFYEKRGFEQIDTNAYESGDVSYDTAVYARPLDW